MPSIRTTNNNRRRARTRRIETNRSFSNLSARWPRGITVIDDIVPLDGGNGCYKPFHDGISKTPFDARIPAVPVEAESLYDILRCFIEPDTGVSQEMADLMARMPANHDEFVAGLPDGLPRRAAI